MSRTFSSESVEALDCFSRCFCCSRHFCVFHLVYSPPPFCLLLKKKKPSAPSLKSNQKVVFLPPFFLPFFRWWNEMRRESKDSWMVNPQLCRQSRIFRNNLARDRSSQLRSSRFLFFSLPSSIFLTHKYFFSFAFFQGLPLIPKSYWGLFVWFLKIWIAKRKQQTKMLEMKRIYSLIDSWLKSLWLVYILLCIW